MIIHKMWKKEKRNILGDVVFRKEYHVVLLFGFIPIYISVNG